MENKELEILFIGNAKYFYQLLFSAIQKTFPVNAEYISFKESPHGKLSDSKPQLVVIDMNIGEIPAIDFIKKILSVAPLSKMIVIVPYHDMILLKKLIALNVKGFITLASTIKEFSSMLKEVSRGHNYASEQLQTLMANLPLSNGTTQWLSEMENQILFYMNQGISARLISITMGVTLRTVEMHRYNILMKLQLPSYAALSGLINSSYGRRSELHFNS